MLLVSRLPDFPLFSSFLELTLCSKFPLCERQDYTLVCCHLLEIDLGGKITFLYKQFALVYVIFKEFKLLYKES